jgi:hypothetical protein
MKSCCTHLIPPPKDQTDPIATLNQHPQSFLPLLWWQAPQSHTCPPTLAPGACTHSQDSTIPLQEVSQLVQQPSTAQGIQPTPWRPPLEGSLGSLHSLVYIGLSDQNDRESVSPLGIAVWSHRGQWCPASVLKQSQGRRAVISCKQQWVLSHLDGWGHQVTFCHHLKSFLRFLPTMTKY